MDSCFGELLRLLDVSRQFAPNLENGVKMNIPERLVRVLDIHSVSTQCDGEPTMPGSMIWHVLAMKPYLQKPGQKPGLLSYKGFAASTARWINLYSALFF